jgi:hypothetical protein
MNEIFIPHDNNEYYSIRIGVLGVLLEIYKAKRQNSFIVHIVRHDDTIDVSNLDGDFTVKCSRIEKNENDIYLKRLCIEKGWAYFPSSKDLILIIKTIFPTNKEKIKFTFQKFAFKSY